MVETLNRPLATSFDPSLASADTDYALLASTVPVIPLTQELKPSEMCDYQAPNAGADAQRVQQEGRAMIDPVTKKPQEDWTFDDFYTQGNAFIQVSGIQGNSPTGNVASFSEQIFLREEKTSEGKVLSAGAIALLMGMRVAGNLNYKWYGERQDKLLFLIEDDSAPEEMLQRLTDAPRRPLTDKISEYQNRLQDLRQFELNATDQGIQFADFFYGRRTRLKRAFQRDGRYSFVWNWQRRGGDLIALNPDSKEQGSIDIYENAPDDGTREMLKAEHEFLVGGEGRNRYVVKITFDAYVLPCCPTASNAQRRKVRSDLAAGFCSSESGVKYCFSCKKWIRLGECDCDEKEEAKDAG